MHGHLEAARLSYHLRSHPPSHRKPAGESIRAEGYPMAHTAAERTIALCPATESPSSEPP
jgi:hypothetical protein